MNDKTKKRNSVLRPFPVKRVSGNGVFVNSYDMSNWSYNFN